ncbi:hypothetical protein FGW20_10270 [Methanoculleus sp. FWC-SCC3]|uniref:Pyrrolo-quinoline quinone repeat domain-containing protein n=1 Tax=Methanoculleus methanifontis TaxID=2584086 RepID=A0ABT8M495_9EURY|nr:hypothetical protein [Methanoculleus sp. FWC-SCC3]
MTLIRAYPGPIFKNSHLNRSKTSGRREIGKILVCLITLCLITGMGQAHNLDNATGTSQDAVQVGTKLYLHAGDGGGTTSAGGSGGGGSCNAVLLWTATLPDTVTAVDMRPDGAVVVAGTADGNVTLFNSSGTTLWAVPSGGPVSAVGIADDGNSIVAGTGDRLMMLDAAGRIVWTVDARSRVLGAGISPDGDRCAAGTVAGDLLVTDNRGGILQEIPFGSAVNTVAAGSDGALIAAGTENGTIRLLDAEGDVLWTHDAGSPVLSVSMTGDGIVIGAGTGDGAVVMLDGEGQGDPVWTAASAANTVHLDADGSALGAGTGGGYAYLMDGTGIKTWQYGRMKTLDGENRAVTGIALSSSADYLVIGSDNRNVYYFAFTSRLPPTVMKETEPVNPSSAEAAPAVTRTSPASVGAVAEALTPQEAPGFCVAACLGAVAIAAASRRKGR